MSGLAAPGDTVVAPPPVSLRVPPNLEGILAVYLILHKDMHTL